MHRLTGAAVRISLIVGMISFAGISAGCSELEVTRLSSFPSNAPLVGAITYYLPRTVITVNGTVTLDSCEPAHGQEPPKLSVLVTITPITSFEPDPAHHYSIAYESSRSWMKEFQVQVDNSASGTLQSFSGTINDQVGPTIVAAIGAAAQIGSAIGVAGAPRPAALFSLRKRIPDLGLPDIEKSEDYCADVRDVLSDIETQKEIIKAAKEKPVAKKEDIDVQNAVVQAAIGKIDELRKQKKLVRSFTFRWVPRRTDQFRYFKARFAAPVLGRTSRSPVQGYWVAGRHISLVPIIKQWLTASGQRWLDEVPTSKGMIEKDKTDPRTALAAPYVVSLAFADTSMGDPRQNENASPGGANPTGLVIRDPAMGFLKICHQSDSNCDGQNAVLLEDRPVETTSDVSRVSVSIAQFGRILILPQRSGLFENAVLGAGLNPDGTISKMSFHSSSSLIAGLGGLGTAANSVAAGVAARNTAIAAANSAQKAVSDAATAQIQAPGIYNKALADCLANQAAIVKAGYTPVPCQ